MVGKFSLFRKSLISMLLILLFIIGLSSCSTVKYGIPTSTWENMTKEQHIKTIQEYYSESTIIVLRFLARDVEDPLKGLMWVYPEDYKVPFWKNAFGYYQRYDIGLFSPYGFLRGPSSSEFKNEKNGIFFWKIHPGPHELRFYGNADYSDVQYIHFEAEAATIIDLGTIYFSSSHINTESGYNYARYYYSWNIHRTYDSVAIKLFSKYFPEIYEALRKIRD